MKTESLIPAQLPEVDGVEAAAVAAAPKKRAFVEPEVSFPIDVLEATTFFVPTDSGCVANNPTC